MNVSDILPKNVLIVEDVEDLADLARQVLSDQFVVRSAPDAATAIEIAALVRPDVVVLDVQLRRSSGIEVARILHGTCVLIGCSGSDDLRREDLALFDSFILKPYRPRQLLKTVLDAVAVRGG
jgi:DNA-binding response OmpR family regulator